MGLDVAHDRTHANELPCSEQTLPVLPLEALTVPGSISVEPQFGRCVGQASGVHQPTSQVGSSGTSGFPDVPLALPPGQGLSAPNLLMPLTRPQLQVEESEGAHSRDTNQAPNEIFLEQVFPKKGPMTGGVDIAIFGENFPSTPLYVGFGGNWVRAVSQT